MSGSSSGKSGKAGSGGSKQHDYYGSIAGIICQGRLDFIWGLQLDGKLVWPTAIVIDATLDWATATADREFTAGQIIAYNGRIWEANINTSNPPPHADWDLFHRNRTDLGVGNPYKFTVENWGDAYLYWGTDDQALDTVNEKFLNNHGHPPYRHRAVLALKDFLFGTERQSAPNAVVLGGRTPMQTLITGDAAELDDDWQANPWCVIAELLTHPVIGLGLPDSLFDATSWQAEADWCLANHATTYISPIYDRQQQVRNIVADLLQYTDGFTFWTTDRTIAAGHWPHGDEPPAFTDANTIDIHDLVERVSWRAQTWRDTTNATTVNYNDINYAFNSVPAIAYNGANRAATRRVQSCTLDRQHIVRATQAAAVAAEDAKINGQPSFSGTLRVRAEKVAGIGAGDIFLLTDDSQQLSRACRCTRKTLTAPPAGTASIEFETERGLAELPYRATPLNPTPAQPPPPARITHFEFIQVPPQLTLLDLDHQFVCLAGRNNDLTSRLGIWWQNEGDAFEQLAEQTGFAVFGTINVGINTQTVTDEDFTDSAEFDTPYQLAARNIWHVTIYDGTQDLTAVEGTDYTVDTETGMVTILEGGSIMEGDVLYASYAKSISVHLAAETPTQDIERISASLTQDQINNNTLLLFLLKASDPRQFEILSVKAVTPAGGGNYVLTVVRSRYGTRFDSDVAYEFTTDDRAFLIYRNGLTFFTHESFAATAAVEGEVTFRMTPGTAWAEAPVEVVYDAGTNPNGLTTEAEYSFLDPYAPEVAFVGVFADDGLGGAFTAVADFGAANFVPGTRFRLVVNVTDRNADLTSYSISFYQGGSVGTLIDSNDVSATAFLTRTFEFTLTAIGQYRVVLSAKDRTGRVTDQFLTNVGETDEQFISIQEVSEAKVSAPVVDFAFTNTSHTSLTVYGATCATSGATIHVKNQFKGVTPPLSSDGGWTVYNGFTNIRLNVQFHTLYFYASKTGDLDPSDVVSVG